MKKNILVQIYKVEKASTNEKIHCVFHFLAKIDHKKLQKNEKTRKKEHARKSFNLRMMACLGILPKNS